MVATYGKQFDFYTAVSAEAFPLEMFLKEDPADGKVFLPLSGREAWFRCRYPHGKLETHTLYLDNDQAVVMARVYKDVADAENEFLSCITVRKFRKDWGRKYLDAAMNAAISRALGSAGYGSPTAVMHEGASTVLEVPPYIDEADAVKPIRLRTDAVQESRQETAA